MTDDRSQMTNDKFKETSIARYHTPLPEWLSHQSSQQRLPICHLSFVICHSLEASGVKAVQISQTRDAILLNGGSVRQVDFHPSRTIRFPFDLIDSLRL